MDTEVHFFDNDSFFKNGERVHIQLSTEFPKFVGVLHKHQFIEVVYILSGSAIHTVAGKEYGVKCGDVAVINCGVPHKFTSNPESTEPFVAYDLMFAPDFFDATAINMSDFESLKNCFLFSSLFPAEEQVYPDMHIEGRGFSDYGELFTRIYHEFGRKEKGYIQLIRAYVIELIIRIFRDVEKTRSVELSLEKRKTVDMAVKYIEENYNMKLSVDDIAARVFLGADYFRKLFKQATGNSVTSFMQKLRIDEACRLLSTTDIPIKDICRSVGYGDMTAFYQTFKKMMGKTPKEYRFDK